ncbi:MAG: low molecular weight protein arginine phosphatase [Clostridium sp.]|uniref:low molecular weight protein arginine phosphatase n=1 Tax=Clostridium chrysemydis TaxID=2665504 RepID=UPI003EE7326F
MNVLFVCTANVCRSPIAAEILNKLSKKIDIIADSAGITIIPGSLPTEKSINLVKDKLNIDINDREAKQVSIKKLEKADIVLTMSSYSRDFIKEKFPKFKNKVYTITEYAGVKGGVTDPYGSSVVVYQKTYEELEELVSRVLDRIKKEGSM